MDTMFMDSDNSKTSDPHRLLLIVLINLKGGNKYVVLSNYTWKNIKMSYKNNKLKIADPK